ncbi:acyltransferase [Streptomyces sp. NPDC045431]|uniref:acyltransferase family protein n=1 Tax=Streptomyces sp. NPDC045431 TaxID=3155613 RepID=UPI00340AC559
MSQVSTPTQPIPWEAQPPSVTPAKAAAAGGRIYALDGLRLIAAVVVMLFHFLGVDAALKAHWEQSPKVFAPNAFGVAVYGHYGVQLFFLISGFVICMSAWGRTPRQFVSARFVRLFPAYWVSVVAVALLWRLLPDGQRRVPSLSESLANLTMIQKALGARNLAGVYWTLWVELCFYLLFLIVVWKGLTYARVSWFAWLWLLGSTLVPGNSDVVPLYEIFASPGNAPFFVGGIGMYLLYRFGPDLQSVCLVAASWLVAQYETYVSLRIKAAEAKAGAFVENPYIAVAVITGCFLIVLAIALHLLDGVKWRWLATAGALSYPLYLIHAEFGWAVIRVLDDRIGVWPTVVVACVSMMVAAALLHWCAEKPLARRVRRAVDRVGTRHG